MPHLNKMKKNQRKVAKRISSTKGLPSEFSQKSIGKRLRSTEGVGDKLAGFTAMSGVESRKSRRPKGDVFNQIGL